MAAAAAAFQLLKLIRGKDPKATSAPDVRFGPADCIVLHPAAHRHPTLESDVAHAKRDTHPVKGAMRSYAM